MVEWAEIKPDVGENVTLMVLHEEKPDFYFTMKRDDSSRKLMVNYCERMKLGDVRV